MKKLILPAILLTAFCHAEDHINHYGNGVKKMLYQQNNIININQDEVESIHLYVVDAIIADWYPNAEQIKASIGKKEGYHQGREVGYYVIKPKNFHLFVKKLNTSKVLFDNSKKFSPYRLLIEINLKNGERVNVLSSDNSSETGFFDSSIEKNGVFYYVLFDSADMTKLFKQANENRLIFN